MRFFSRCVAAFGASAAATKPSQRQRSPSRLTSRCPGFKPRLQPRTLGAVDDADLRQPAGEQRRALDVAAKRLDAVGKRRVLRQSRSTAAPVRRRFRIGGGVEIVAEGGAERRLVAGLDAHRIDDRDAGLRRARQKVLERRRLGFDAAEAALGLAGRLARRQVRRACRGRRPFGGQRVGFRRRQRRLGSLRRGAVLGRQRRPPEAVSISPISPVTLASSARWRVIRSSASRCVRSYCPRRAEISASAAVSSVKSRSLAASAVSLVRLRAAALVAALGHVGVGRLEALLLLVEAGEDAAVVGDHALFADDVVAELREAAVEFVEPIADARLFLVRGPRGPG